MKWPSVKFHNVVLSSVLALSCDTADQADIGQQLLVHLLV